MKQMIDKKIYVEVFEVIKKDKNFIDNIPVDLLEHIKKNALRSRL